MTDVDSLQTIVMLERRDFLNLSPVPRPEGYWLHVSRPAMACRFEITLPMSDENGVAVAQVALEEADRLERQLSVFKPDSEVSEINREAGSREVKLEPELFRLLAYSQTIFAETEGAFDITSGPLTRCWGFLKREGRVPNHEEIKAALGVVGGDKLHLIADSQTIAFAKSGVEINLGSIGKGYALDRIARLMRRQIRTALLSAGSSSMLAIGSGADGRGWLTGIRHPRKHDRRLAVLRLRNAALSTSGHEEQFFEFEGNRYGHIIDPRTGSPAEGVSGVTVIAGSAAEADALATAFYVGGATLAEAYCETHPETMAVMLESESEQARVFGKRESCSVELINE